MLSHPCPQHTVIQFQHKLNEIMLHTQCRHKNKHVLTLTLFARYEQGHHLLTYIINTETTNTCCHRDKLNEGSILQPLAVYFNLQWPRKTDYQRLSTCRGEFTANAANNANSANYAPSLSDAEFCHHNSTIKTHLIQIKITHGLTFTLALLN